MITNPRRPRPAIEIVALLDLSVESLAALETTSDRLAQFREATRLLNDLVDQVGRVPAADLPEHFHDRVLDARHCVKMGKPRECKIMLERLQGELSGFWTD